MNSPECWWPIICHICHMLEITRLFVDDRLPRICHSSATHPPEHDAALSQTRLPGCTFTCSYPALFRMLASRLESAVVHWLRGLSRAPSMISAVLRGPV